MQHKTESQLKSKRQASNLTQSIGIFINEKHINNQVGTQTNEDVPKMKKKNIT